LYLPFILGFMNTQTKKQIQSKSFAFYFHHLPLFSERKKSLFLTVNFLFWLLLLSLLLLLLLLLLLMLLLLLLLDASNKIQNQIFLPFNFCKWTHTNIHTHTHSLSIRHALSLSLSHKKMKLEGKGTKLGGRKNHLWLQRNNILAPILIGYLWSGKKYFKKCKNFEYVLLLSFSGLANLQRNIEKIVGSSES